MSSPSEPRREDLARFEAIARRSSDVAVFFDGDFTIRWVSPAVREVFGLDDVALVGAHGLDLIHPEDRDGVLATFVDQLQTPGDHVQVAFRMVDGRGRERWVEEVATDLLADPEVGFVVGNLRDVTDRMEAHAEQLRAAMLDALTGLTSRDQLFTLLRAGNAAGGALVFFDVVDLCDVNNSLGPAAGDALLVNVARRIEATLPDGCTFARIGNDQFAVLRPGSAGLTDALEVVQAIRTGLSTPFAIGADDVFVSVCFGAAHDHTATGDDLARQADMALYQAKRQGPDELVVFEPGLERSSQDRVSHAAALKLALSGGGVVPYYQPVVELSSGRVVAVEALARWDHPDLGFVSPETFIPVAEASGLISDLGAQVLLRACTDAARWMAGGRRLQVAVNVSAVQLTDPGFVDLVAAVLASTGLPPERLTLEITETSALRDLDAAMAGLVLLDQRGVLLSVDDFGTGYSSLVLLARLPVGAVKIDRSFVDGLGHDERMAQIVAGTVALGTALGFHTVAEGIERPDQIEALVRMGCAFGQGFHWSPAVPAADVLPLIDHIERTAGHGGRPADAVRLTPGCGPASAARQAVDHLPQDR
ncbi:bifunctional diguanylate cyclase/phosphodiesterase [Aquihabitans sp. G128]|uniref:putative bifunctional diguanylate cyclase/phosphodiesterase n=1 Tax=Aquihabitans sp. G128 TaxID=2849779 RepID=UPI001C2214F3|nr:bifunctional diguanylate cyclase/phosphodiesterase [Aquihabitans sp. G128]QXC62485.1 bifunctional diguanylate cyclase/phosphodiesterase [Aquihabitans sp. G128]